ncbi:metal-dependent hydrolase [Candidatus Bathyarchaeota archaeon]|nr:metal-dependent hydrolase [Candidatus Bathyarchaeota archaeon]
MEPVIHFAVPFFALILAGVELKRALPISLLALMPDLDALFLVHRSISHSLIVVLTSAAPFLLLAHRLRRGYFSTALLGLFSVSSHLILDLFNGYTPILWPLYGYSLWVKMGLTAYIGGSLNLQSSIQILTRPIEFQRLHSLDAPIFTGESLIVSAILVVSLLVKGFMEFLRRLHRA